MKLTDRLKHFENNQKEQGDKYGAEVLYQSRKRIEELEEVIGTALPSP